MRRISKILICFMIIFLIIGAEASQISNQSNASNSESEDLIFKGDFGSSDIDYPKKPYSLKDLVIELQNATVNQTDTDGDGLYDSVEAVLGTNFNNTDSDFDNLNDTYEVNNGLDPLEPDTNRDGLSDYQEVTNVNLDLDNDGIPNAWDFDNDNDQVVDRLDESPFAKSTVHDTFYFNLTTDEEPIFLTLQIRPEDPAHLRLMEQSWNWPDGDAEGTMKDLDNSTRDVIIMPWLRLTANDIPDQQDVITYGMLVTSDGWEVALRPVREYGSIVALSGMMFHPSPPANLSLQAELVWKVTGFSDVPLKALETVPGTYVTIGNGGVAVANTSQLSEGGLQWVDLGLNKTALRVPNGAYLSIADDGTLIANGSVIEERETFLLDNRSGNIGFKSSFNDKYLSVRVADGVIIANSSDFVGFNAVDAGYYPEITDLVTYNDNFMLTGLSIEESYGTDVGLFYHDTTNQTIRACLLLDYVYCLNATTTVWDIPAVLATYNVTLFNHTESFQETSNATFQIGQELIPTILSSLPENEVLPIILILDDYSKTVDLSDLLTGSYIVGNSNFINITGAPLVFAKSLNMNFYNTSSYKKLILDEIWQEIDRWGLLYNATPYLMTFVTHWYIGVRNVMSVGGFQTMAAPIPIPFAIMDINTAMMIGQANLDLIGSILGSLGPKILELQATARMESFWSVLYKLRGKFMSSASWKEFKVFKISQAMKGSKFASFFKVLSKFLVVIDILLTVYFAFNSIKNAWDTAEQFDEIYGESFGNEYRAVYTITAIIAYYYMIAAIIIVSIFTFGTATSIAITIAMIIISFLLDFLIAVFVNLILGEMQDYFHAEADIGIEGTPETTIMDNDDNGMDVGDRIEVLMQLVGIYIGSGSNPTLQDNNNNSYIVPWINIIPPQGSGSNTSQNLKTSLSYINPWAWEANTILLNRTSTTKISPRREDRYNSSAWIEPGIGMVNFPVKLQLNAEYQLYQKQYHEWFGWLFGSLTTCWHEKYNKGSTTPTTLTTIYYDVLPGNLTDFLSWKDIIRNDYDGDGLNDTYEESLGVSNKWRYDTDADGLNDKYEIEEGTDPSNCDTDEDGLIDKFEYVYTSNATNKDSDGDGIFDYLELAGWIVSFNYSGQLFQMRVFSDPALNDTDEDGYSDGAEYWSGLNPRSDDTNGDGVKDVAVPQTEIIALLQNSIEIENDIMKRPSIVSDFSVDDEGNVYFPAISSGYNDTIVKLDSNLTYYNNWTLDSSSGIVKVDQVNKFIFVESAGTSGAFWNFSLNGVNYGLVNLTYDAADAVGIDFDSNGFIYVTQNGTFTQISKFFPNGTYEAGYGSAGLNPEQFKRIGTIAVDDTYGFIYVLDGDGITSTQRIMKFNKTDGSFITTLPNGYGKMVDIAVDSDGWVYVLDLFDPELGEGCVRRFDHNGMEDRNFILTDINGTPPWLLVQYPIRIEVDPDKNIYILENGTLDNPNPRILKFKENITLIPPEIPNDKYDWDGDGLGNLFEIVGWNSSFVNNGSVTTLAVNSEPLVRDTDFDGLTDYLENLSRANPRNPDTDGDGLSDFYEWELGTNLTNDDTDGDGLSDSNELLINSNPINDSDTDDDGLGDVWEFQLGSNPTKIDTDDDGALDLQEFLGNSSLLDPDSDDDFMFDGLEYTLNCDPNDPDTDNDDLIDGEELIHGTNATDPDTDDDGAIDGLEVDLWLDPLNNDTDDDGLLDWTELFWGSNPFNNDTDADGVPDNLDNDTLLTFTAPIIVAFNSDPYDNNLLFAQNLALVGNVTIVSYADFMANHTNASHIVLVGRPAPENNTLSGLIYNLTADTGNMLTAMMAPDSYQMMVRYGVWRRTQIVIILSQAFPMDSYAVFSSIKAKNVTTGPNSYFVKYQTTPIFHNQTAYKFGFKVDDIDAVKLTDSMVAIELEDWALPSLQMTKYTSSTAPYSLTRNNGLDVGAIALGKYLELTLTINGSTTDTVDSALIQIYYRLSDLDHDGNGIVGDPFDIDETTLALYWYDETTGSWEKLTEDLDWVLEVGINTTDIELYGESYAGYIWARVTHLSTYGVGGLTIGIPPFVFPLVLLLTAVSLGVTMYLLEYRSAQKARARKKKEEKVKWKTKAPEKAQIGAIEDIEGIGPQYANLLKQMNINTTEDLRTISFILIAEATDLSPKLLYKWQCIADLFRVRRAAEEYTEFLFEMGIHTVRQLSEQQIDAFYEEVQAFAAEVAQKPGWHGKVKKVPTRRDVETWIASAKELIKKGVP